ncbi:hypothetical protein GALL_552750 [mine drainage metagenome]|uniref:Uncharacterized protein n=1 Tax=mine drainage metagenome TaxID=410659 RepID=A0A1J5NVE4_9ZZZZ
MLVVQRRIGELLVQPHPPAPVQRLRKEMPRRHRHHVQRDHRDQHDPRRVKAVERVQIAGRLIGRLGVLKRPRAFRDPDANLGDEPSDARDDDRHHPSLAPLIGFPIRAQQAPKGLHTRNFGARCRRGFRIGRAPRPAPGQISGRVAKVVLIGCDHDIYCPSESGSWRLDQVASSASLRFNFVRI